MRPTPFRDPPALDFSDQAGLLGLLGLGLVSILLGILIRACALALTSEAVGSLDLIPHEFLFSSQNEPVLVFPSLV